MGLDGASKCGVLLLALASPRRWRRLDLLAEGLGPFAGEGVELWDQFVGGSDEGADVALRRLARLYRACGFEVEPDKEYEVGALEGREVLGGIAADSFQGQPRARVRAFRPLPRRESAPSAKAEEGQPF